MKPVRITLTIAIPESVVESTVKSIMENFPEASQTLECVGWKYDDWQFKFRDSETGNTYRLEKGRLLATFPLIFTDLWPKGLTQPPASADPERWDDWLCQADAGDFDAFAQLACFGYVIYG